MGKSIEGKLKFGVEETNQLIKNSVLIGFVHPASKCCASSTLQPQPIMKPVSEFLIFVGFMLCC